jgi:uncharacterized protein with FMN-binding domain
MNETKSWRMKPKLHKAIKIIHVVSCAATCGALLSIVSFALMKTGFSAASLKASSLDYASYVLFNGLFTWAFVATVASGLAFSLFSDFGFVRFRWVILKWVLSAGLFALAYLWFGPSVDGCASISDAGMQTGSMAAKYTVSSKATLEGALIIAILLAFVLAISILKPFGSRRIHRDIDRRPLAVAILVLAVLGASFGVMTSIRYHSLRSMKISMPDIAALSDGSYAGSATDGSFIYKVKVGVASHKIVSVESLANRTSSYARLAEGVYPRVVRSQTVDVDAVTGATTTSRVLLEAIRVALASGKTLQ